MHKSNIVVTAIAAAFGIAMSPLAVHAALPDGYTKLEYIESSGTQYINTGIVPKTTTRVVVDFSLTTTAGGQWNGWSSALPKLALSISRCQATGQIPTPASPLTLPAMPLICRCPR